MICSKLLVECQSFEAGKMFYDNDVELDKLDGTILS